MTARCPQRVIAEAIRLLNLLDPEQDADNEESLVFNIQELEALANVLPHKLEF